MVRAAIAALESPHPSEDPFDPENLERWTEWCQGVLRHERARALGYLRNRSRWFEEWELTDLLDEIDRLIRRADELSRLVRTLPRRGER